MGKLEIRFVDSDETLKKRVADEWSEKAARHMHLEDGFSILAMQENDLVGLLSMYWKTLPPPLPETGEGYMDILEVHKDFRRKGIATQLIDISLKRAKEKGVHLSSFLEFPG